MKIFINKIQSKIEESVIFNIHKLNPNLEAIVESLKNELGDSYLLATHTATNSSIKLPYSDICYLEYLERTVFIYTTDNVYETKEALYKLEGQLPKFIIRCSKSMLVNIEKIVEFHSNLNGNLTARLASNEKIIISRRYVKPLKDKLKESI